MLGVRVPKAVTDGAWQALMVLVAVAGVALAILAQHYIMGTKWYEIETFQTRIAVNTDGVYMEIPTKAAWAKAVEDAAFWNGTTKVRIATCTRYADVQYDILFTAHRERQECTYEDVEKIPDEGNPIQHILRA